MIAVVLLSVFQRFGPMSQRIAPVPYSEFLNQIKDGSVDEVTFDEEVIRFISNDEPDEVLKGYCQLERSMFYNVGNVAVVSLIRDCAVVEIVPYAP